MARREQSTMRHGQQRRRPSARRISKTDLGGRLLLGPHPEPLWQRLTTDTQTVTEAIYTDVGQEPWQILPSPRHFVLDLVINSQRRETRVFHTKQEALTQGMAWYRQYASPFHRLAMRLHVPDTIAARGTLGVQLPRNGQSLACELFAFHNGRCWQVLINADSRPLLTREYRTEAAACLDAWGLAWKLQGHALPWPAHWLPTPEIVRKAMARYDRIPTVAPPDDAGADEASGMVGGEADLAAVASGLEEAAGQQGRAGSGAGERDASATDKEDESADPGERGGTRPFRLLHFAPPPHKIVRRRRPLREL